MRRYYTATHDLTLYRGKYRRHDLATTDRIKVINYVSLLMESMGIATAPDEYAQWKNAGSEAAIRESIGPERIAKIGAEFFAKQVLPELRRLPEK